MQEIYFGLKDNLDVSKYSNPQFTKEQMSFIREALKQNEDVTSFANPNFTYEEMKRIFLNQ